MQLLKAADIKTGKQTIFIYAPPGFGKTTLLGMLPGKTLIIDIDQGTSVLQGNKNVDVIQLHSSMDDWREAIDYLNANAKEYQNICIDSLSELERAMLTAYGREGKNDGAPEMQHYLKVQYKLADYCRLLRGLSGNTLFTAWEELREFVAPSGEKYTQARPLLGGKSVDLICGLCDTVGRLVISQKDGNRYVQLEGSTTVVAKDRLKKRKFCTCEELI